MLMFSVYLSAKEQVTSYLVPHAMPAYLFLNPENVTTYNNFFGKALQ